MMMYASRHEYIGMIGLGVLPFLSSSVLTDNFTGPQVLSDKTFVLGKHFLKVDG